MKVNYYFPALATINTIPCNITGQTSASGQEETLAVAGLMSVVGGKADIGRGVHAVVGVLPLSVTTKPTGEWLEWR